MQLHMHLLAGAAIVLPTVAAGLTIDTAGVYAFTGFEDQPSSKFTKTTLYRIDPASGDVDFVVNYDAGVVVKPDNYTCLAGQSARMGLEGGVIYGMPGGADSPLIVHDLEQNVSFCDDGIENLWGLTPLQHQAHVGPHGNDEKSQGAQFAAFSSSYTPMFGEWSFSIGKLTVNADPAGQEAKYDERLSFQNGESADSKYFACAVIDTDMQDRVAVDIARQHLYVMCDSILLTVDTSKQQWKITQDVNLTAAQAKTPYTLTSILEFSHTTDSLAATAVSAKERGSSDATLAMGFLNTTTGEWLKEPFEVKAATQDAKVAYDPSSETAYVYTKDDKQTNLLIVDLTSGSSTAGTPVSDAIGVSDLLYVGSEVAPAPAPAGKHTCGQHCSTDADCDQTQACKRCEKYILHQCVT